MVTAADGKFTLRDANPGVHMMTVERDGYVVPRRKQESGTVQAGESTSSVRPKLVRTGAISGRALDAGGQSRDCLIRDSKGESEFADVLPGTYRLHVEAGGFNEPNRMSAYRTVEVGGSDVDGIQIAPAPEGQKVPSRLPVILASRDAGDTQGGGMAQVDTDGAFTIPRVPPGESALVVGSTIGGDDDSYIYSIRLSTGYAGSTLTSSFLHLELATGRMSLSQISVSPDYT